MAGPVLVVANDVDILAGNGAWLDAELYILLYTYVCRLQKLSDFGSILSHLM